MWILPFFYHIANVQCVLYIANICSVESTIKYIRFLIRALRFDDVILTGLRNAFRRVQLDLLESVLVESDPSTHKLRIDTQALDQGCRGR
jgi:hypothetical protein